MWHLSPYVSQSACNRWPNVGPTQLTLLAQGCKPTLALSISANRAYVAPSCWLYVGPTVGPIVGLHWHGWANHWSNVGPTCRHIKGPMMINFVNNILYLFSIVHMSWTMWIVCLLRQIKPDLYIRLKMSSEWLWNVSFISLQIYINCLV